MRFPARALVWGALGRALVGGALGRGDWAGGVEFPGLACPWTRGALGFGGLGSWKALNEHIGQQVWRSSPSVCEAHPRLARGPCLGGGLPKRLRGPLTRKSPWSLARAPWPAGPLARRPLTRFWWAVAGVWSGGPWPGGPWPRPVARGGAFAGGGNPWPHNPWPDLGPIPLNGGKPWPRVPLARGPLGPGAP